MTFVLSVTRLCTFPLLVVHSNCLATDLDRTFLWMSDEESIMFVRQLSSHTHASRLLHAGIASLPRPTVGVSETALQISCLALCSQFHDRSRQFLLDSVPSL